jgi:hypothetical protein
MEQFNLLGNVKLDLFVKPKFPIEIEYLLKHFH